EYQSFNMEQKLRDLLEERILILDGAMGTLIQDYRLTEEDFRGTDFRDHPVDVKGNNELLNITRPDIIETIHYKYLEAGADIIETNTFNGNAVSQADYAMEHIVDRINIEGARAARQAADRYMKQHPGSIRFVGGALGPTTKTASLSPDVNRPEYRAIDYDTLYKIYKEQATALEQGGVDLFILETVTDTLNTKAAIQAILELEEEIDKHIPLIISGTITDNSGRILS